MDCKRDTSEMGEYYFVNTELWLSVVPDIYGMLCIGCLEERIGRKLLPNDFTDCFLDKPSWNGRMSLRLLDRIKGEN